MGIMYFVLKMGHKLTLNPALLSTFNRLSSSTNNKVAHAETRHKG